MNSKRIYLEVRFVENEAAKYLGARWDKIAKAWYVPVGQDPVPKALAEDEHGPCFGSPNGIPEQQLQS